MKTLLISLFALAGVAVAQDVAGNWQGTIAAGGRELRAIVRLTKGPAGELGGAFYSIDQTPQPLPLTQVTFAGGTLKFTLPAAGASYEGKLSADGNAMVGTFTQGQATPLSFVKPTPQTAWEIPAPPAPPQQMASADPSFSVSTIKPAANPDRAGHGITFRGQDMITVNTTLMDLITLAYSVQQKQVINAPAWMESEKYDITARPEVAGQPTEAQLRIMMRKLLAERFQLAFHRDQKELNVYTITVGKNGSKLTKSASDPKGLPGAGFRGLGSFVANNADINIFASVMQSNVLDRPIVDQTGLTGKYDFTLTWTPDEFQFPGLAAGARPPAPQLNGADAPNLFVAMEEQLGLKLEPTKAKAEVLVIDKVAKPGEN